MPVDILEMHREIAAGMSDLWRYIVIDHEGNTQKNPLTTQSELLNMFPEINPRFFHNFGITELVIRQANGTQLILKKVR
mgnify:CR=1 FL=1